MEHLFLVKCLGVYSRQNVYTYKVGITRAVISKLHYSTDHSTKSGDTVRSFGMSLRLHLYVEIPDYKYLSHGSEEDHENSPRMNTWLKDQI